MSVTMHLCDNGTSSRTVRHMVREMLVAEGLVTENVADVETILGELCTNVERHGRSQSGKYLLELEIHVGKIIIKVEDRGKGFDFASLPDPNADLVENMLLAGTEREDGFGDVRFGGWGIPTIQSLATNVNYVKTLPTGTTVYVEKSITYLDDSHNKPPSQPEISESPVQDHGVNNSAINISSLFETRHMTTVPHLYDRAAT